ncbi:MAG TPA: type II secretion system protein [Holophagaceae bacterium]|nr:type II secretion system protein [Holophagaceae bacterium]
MIRNRLRLSKGFSLIEILLVLAVIGILSAIAIPSFLGQRHRARVIGDAITNAKSLAMALESRKAETGIYGAPGSYPWTAAGARPSTDIAPSFVPTGNSKMDFKVDINADSLSYTLTVTDPTLSNKMVYQTDQTGAQLFRWN